MTQICLTIVFTFLCDAVQLSYYEAQTYSVFVFLFSFVQQAEQICCGGARGYDHDVQMHRHRDPPRRHRR